MAYDEGLAQRVRDVLGERPELVEKKMFGGIAFIVRGNMACGVREDGLIVRVGPADYERAVMEPHTRPFDMTGRPMTGWVVVVPEGYASDDDLRAWVEQGLDFALTLPPK
ncbi:MAG: TfoX/Sxy family protein [Anaerolineae bacterium]|jgi:TfoX/Sxy family transcriptional regulator of competence genes